MIDLELLVADFQAWGSAEGVDTSQFDERIEASRSLAKERQPLEASVASQEDELGSWTKYIDFETNCEADSTARTKTLFERALIPHCLKDELWLKYGSFVVCQRNHICARP